MISYRYSNFLVFAALFVGCTDPSDPTPNHQKTSIEVDTNDVFGSDRFEFVLPRPFALAASFQEAGLSYAPDRTNSVDNITNCTSKGAQLVNFGVYSTDLVYSILNEQPQQTMLYFNALKKLAEEFGMGSIFTEDELALQIEANIANRVVLEELLVDIHERSQEYLEDNDMRYLSAIQFAGAWIEGMYLASYDFSTKDPIEVGYKLNDHMTLVNNTIRGLEMYKNPDTAIEQVLVGLQELDLLFSSFTSVQTAENKAFPQLSPEEIQAFVEKIREIRGQITA
jgi:hypothetical protein